jgi:hypothetical protein
MWIDFQSTGTWNGQTGTLFFNTTAAWWGEAVAPTPILGRAATARLNLLGARGEAHAPFRSPLLERALSRRPSGVDRPHARTVRRRFRDLRR